MEGPSVKGRWIRPMKGNNPNFGYPIRHYSGPQQWAIVPPVAFHFLLKDALCRKETLSSLSWIQFGENNQAKKSCISLTENIYSVVCWYLEKASLIGTLEHSTHWKRLKKEYFLGLRVFKEIYTCITCCHIKMSEWKKLYSYLSVSFLATSHQWEEYIFFSDPDISIWQQVMHV